MSAALHKGKGRQSREQNLLLASCPMENARELSPYLQEVVLEFQQVLHQTRQAIFGDPSNGRARIRQTYQHQCDQCGTETFHELEILVDILHDVRVPVLAHMCSFIISNEHQRVGEYSHRAEWLRVIVCQELLLRDYPLPSQQYCLQANGRPQFAETGFSHPHLPMKYPKRRA